MKLELIFNKLFSRLYPRTLERSLDPGSDQGRKILHQQIIDDILYESSTQQISQSPVAYFIGGGSATGKSTLRKRIMKEQALESRYSITVVDPDELKNLIPEYENLKKTIPINAASVVHKESCLIRDKLVERLIADRRSFIYESTLAKPKKYKALFQKLIEKNYEIHLFITDIPLELAKKRAVQRAEMGGRSVPLKVIENTHKLVPKTFLAVKSMADSYSIYENTNSMKLILNKTIKDKQIYENFLRKRI